MTQLLLLGAGASVNAGIPGTYALTQKLLNLLNSDPTYEKQSKLLNLVTGGLLYQLGAKGSNPFHGVNVEHLFTAVQTLGERETLNISPFIGSWSPLLTELDSGEVSTLSGHRLLELIGRAFSLKSKLSQPYYLESPGYGYSPSNEVSQVLTAIVHEATRGLSSKLFEETNDTLIQRLHEIIYLDAAKADLNYIIPLVDFVAQNRFTIASLNYDNVIELAARKKGHTVNDGIRSWSETGQITKGNEEILLLKLHGSIDWALSNKEPTYSKPIPSYEVKRVGKKEMTLPDYRPALIFGGRNKLTVDGPFLELLRAFSNELHRASKVAVIGYSFGDQHINKYLTDWINFDESRILTILDPKIRKNQNAYTELLFDLQKTQRVKIIKKTAAKGITELISILQASPVKRSPANIAQ